MVTKPHTDPTDLTNFSFDDVKSHGGFTTASLQRLTQIPQISRNFSFDDVKSHGGTSIALEKKHLFYPLKIHYHRFIFIFK